MDSRMITTSPNSTRAKSAGPISPHRSPMDDVNSSESRKRPRLGSGNRTLRSMSVDRPSSSPPLSVSTNHPVTQDDAQPDDSTTSLPPPTPTKVTINLRESSQLANESPVATGGAPDANGANDTASRQASPRRPVSPKVASLPSSPTGSPEIQIAEVEDIGDEPAVTRWRPLKSSVHEARRVQEDMMARFQAPTFHKSLRKAIASVVASAERNDLSDGQLFERLADWIEMYLEATQDLVAHWWDMLMEQREFWDDFPGILDAFILRRGDTGKGSFHMMQFEIREGGHDDADPVTRFLSAWTALALRMVQIDQQTLEDATDDANTIPDLVSDRYLHMLPKLFEMDHTYWKPMVDTHEYEIRRPLLAMAARFMGSQADGMPCLTRTSLKILDRHSSLVALASKIEPQLLLIDSLTIFYRYCLNQISAPLLPTQLYEYFQAIEPKLQNLISKQVSGLSISLCFRIIHALSMVLWSLAFSDERFARRICLATSLEIDGLSSSERADLLMMRWKCETIWRCIVEGRMEIRVLGVDLLQQELVRLHGQYADARHKNPEHPVTTLLSNFLIQNKVIQYLVSPESHPQLIHRSHNVIGYLLVTRKLTTVHWDVIWDAVSPSQESRSGEALLSCLMQCLTLGKQQDLYYLLGKLNTIPASGFDPKICQFAGRMLYELRGKTPERGDDFDMLDMPPFDLCIRLIRESAPDVINPSENCKRVHSWAIQSLIDLLPYGPSPEAKERIFEDCLNDISAPKMSATGSISAMTTLMGESKANDTVHLARDLNMTSILVRDLARMVHISKERGVSPIIAHECLTIRLLILQLVLHYSPETLSPEDSSLLWDCMVGSKAINDPARDVAWETLIRVARKSQARNEYIDLCISRLLPILPPRFLVPGSLEFAEAVLRYISQSADSRTPGDQLEGSTAVELMWHLSLNIPPGREELVNRAIDLLIKMYLDSPDAKRRSREANDSVHVELVERCINQLTNAASKLRAFTDGTSSGDDEPMIIVAPDNEIQEQKLSFSRSLKILNEFVQGVRSRPMYNSPSPAPVTKIPKDFEELIGEPITVKYQAHSSKSGDINTFHVGSLETVRRFVHKIMALTGFSDLKIYAGGEEFPFSNYLDQTLGNVEALHKGLVLIRKITPDNLHAFGIRPMEVEVLRHFEDLYRLLGMEESLARQVYHFLIAFPPHASIMDLVQSGEAPLDAVFPETSPFKVLYSVYALKSNSGQRETQQTASQRYSVESINRIATTLANFQLNIVSQGHGVDLLVARGLVGCLAELLDQARKSQQPNKQEGKISADKPVVTMEDVPPLLPAAQELVERCVSLSLEASTITNSTVADELVLDSTKVLLKSSILCPNAWTALKATQSAPRLFKRLLLEEFRLSNRQNLLKAMKEFCVNSSATSLAPKPDDFSRYLFHSLLRILPESGFFGPNSEQYFDAVFSTFASLSLAEKQRLNISDSIKDWTEMLCKYRHTEVIGRGEIDFFVLGLSKLLNHYLQLALEYKIAIDPCSDLRDIFRTQLFPDSSDHERMPNLNPTTREQLYHVVLKLSQIQDEFPLLLSLVRDIHIEGEEGSQAWTYGIAETVEDFACDTNWFLDRSRILRGPAGYPGLRNLSNTCYMNSLFTHLFMNVEFRRFILNVNVADSRSSQRLLHEIRVLFGFMQESYSKSIDTQNIAESIVTYDNTAVDVTHQVDVDEFFNLLFDRLEGQILSEADKKTFRGFFGGQIVQQIKSKECAHISERLEPFSAIQCDISGKTTLAESLNAYVQGEAMEGDNKYSCTSCGKYVDAMKRACLKEVPNNLIFHLKRFDYDLIHGTRTKINERFEFPMEIDMAPYNVDYLKDVSEPPNPDVFKLVGVLVHQGTAESGHYYSYIQERPSQDHHMSKWVEFNDTEVSEFNPFDIDSQCFGGWQEMPNYENRYPKLWNAYMLFYERITPSEGLVQDIPPVKYPMPQELKNHISLCNHDLLQQYCQLDPAYHGLIKNMVLQLREGGGSLCSMLHVVEKDTIWLALECLDKVLARTKDLAAFDEMLITLTRAIGTCPTCCGIALQWLIENDYPLSNLLLRCPHLKVRRDFENMVCLTLGTVKQHAPVEYGMHEMDDENFDPEDGQLIALSPGSFVGIANRLQAMWDHIYPCGRAWDDYFGLLSDMASLGTPETHVLLRLGILKNCLELLICDNPSARGLRSHPPYREYVRLVEKGRKFSFIRLAELVARLFEHLDFTQGPTAARTEDREIDTVKVPLTEVEFQYVHHRHAGSKSSCIFLEKLLNNATNAPTPLANIISSMVLAEPEARFHPLIHLTLKNGCSVEPAYLAAPFLRATLAYCECTPVLTQAERLITDIATDVHSIANSGGREHLDFFRRARRLRSRRILIPEQPADIFNRIVLKTVYLWAPHLLIYHDEDIRAATIEVLNSLIFDYDIENMDDEEFADLLLTSVKKLCSCSAQRCNAILQEGKPVGRSAQQIVDVIAACLRRYYSEDEDGGFIANAEDIMIRVNALAVSDLDDQTSVAWDNPSDDPPTDSDSSFPENTP